MKTIKINGKALKVSVAQERSLRHLQASGYVAAKSDFWTGPRRFTRCELETGPEYGVQEVYRDDDMRWARMDLPNRSPRRVREWFESHPRHRVAVAANPRRVNAILRSLNS
jgi:hypothetical protein